MEIPLNGVKPLNILACICKVAVVLGLMSVLLKEHFTLPAMQLFYIVQELTRLHCYIYKKPTVFLIFALRISKEDTVLMYVPPALNLTNRQVSVGTTLYVDCLATTNGSQLALYY